MKEVKRTTDNDFSVKIEDENDDAREINNLSRHQAYMLLYGDDFINGVHAMAERIRELHADRVMTGEEIVKIVINDHLAPLVENAIMKEERLDFVELIEGNKDDTN